MTYRDSTLPFKDYVPLEHRSVRLREIRSKETKSEETHCRGVFIFGSYILHAIRTQCDPSEAVVYYFRYLTAARLPACFPLHSIPSKFRHIRIYLFRSYGKIRKRFSESSSMFNVYSENDSENNIDFICKE